jgi:hypothetical protein
MSSTHNVHRSKLVFRAGKSKRSKRSLMPRFQYEALSCRLGGDEGQFHLQFLVETDWKDADEIGSEGWELVGFFPEAEPYIEDAFKKKEVPLVRVALLKRSIAD